MAAMILDAQTNAFKDADTPLIWDEQAQAYKDSTGLVYDERAGVWSERWGTSKKLIIFDGSKGGDNTAVTGGYTKGYNANGSSGSFSISNESLTVIGASTGNQGECGAVSKKPIDFSTYKKLGFRICSIRQSIYYASYNYTAFRISITKSAGFNNVNNDVIISVDYRKEVNLNEDTYIDISNMSVKTGFVQFIGYAGSGGATFTKIWLE